LLINKNIPIQIELSADWNRNSLQSPPVKAGNAATDVRIGLENEELPLTIQHRLRREQNVSSDDPIDSLFVNESSGASRIAEIDSHHRFIDQNQPADPQLTRNRHVVERSVDLNACR